jgi:MFS family permease
MAGGDGRKEEAMRRWSLPFVSRRFYFGWVLVGALGFTTVVSYGTTYYAFGVLVVPIANELGASRAVLSAAYSLSILLAGFLGFPIGRLLDRHGPRGLMVTGNIVGGLVLVALSAVREVWQFDLLWGVGLGVATALTFYSVSFTVIANWFRRRRGSAMAWLTTIGGLASPVFIPLVGWLVPQVGWRETLVFLGLAQLAIAVPIHALLLRRHPEDMGLEPDGTISGPSPGDPVRGSDRLAGTTLRRAIADPTFWALTAAGGIEQLAAMVVVVHQIPFMIARGFDPIFAAGIAGLVGIVSLPGRFLLNRASDRFGSQLLLAIVLAILGLGTAVFTLASSAVGLYAYVAIYGIAFGARSPLRASVMADHYGRRDYGAITAVQGVVVAVPAALGPLAAGWLFDRLGSYSVAFWLTAALILAAAAIIFLTPRPDRTVP